jgi:hypothetical protein
MCSYSELQQMVLWACAVVWIPGIAGWFALGGFLRFLTWLIRGR